VPPQEVRPPIRKNDFKEFACSFGHIVR
jgi:hypothetical protein